MDAKYVDWVRGQIAAHAPNASEPERVQTLALTAFNLSRGGGTLFGMHWPSSGLGETEKLRDEALLQLGRWFDCLDDHDAVEIARFITKHTLPVPIPELVAEQLRAVESREGLDLPDAPPEHLARMDERLATAPTSSKTAWLNVQAAAQSTMLALERKGWPHEPFMAEPAAAAAHLAAVEHELSLTLPDSFVQVMGWWSRTAFFTWGSGATEEPPPEDVPRIPGGGFELGLWDLGRVIQMKTQCEVWRDAGQHDPGSAAYRLWDRALPFAGQEGRYLALELTGDPAIAPVVFLHRDEDDARGHGWRLAPDLISFLLTWAQLGFPGDDASCFAPFRTDKGISVETDAARRWRAYFFGKVDIG